MLTARLRRLLSAQCLAWWIGALLLAALQPFIAVHFRCDGWEDEPGFRIRSVSETTQFEQDDRSDHPGDRETTLFVPLAASTDSPQALSDGLGAFLAMLALALPLVLLLAPVRMRRSAPPEARPAVRSGAPPPAPWRWRPPSLAPPSPTC